MNSLYFHPSSIEIISRHIYYNHSEGLLKRTVREEITFKNKSEEKLNEIILEIENFKTNLKISNSKESALVYLPNYKIIQRNDIPEDIKEGIKKEDPDDRSYILVIELNKTIEKEEYCSLYLDYIEYTKEEKQNNTYEGLTESKHFMYNEAEYMDVIFFYSKETLSIFNHWGNGLEIGKFDPYIFGSNDSDGQDKDSIIDLDEKKIHLDNRKNCFSFSVSNKYRIKENLDSIAIFYSVKPEKKEYNLIQTLAIVTVLLPFTGITALYFHNISYLFDSLEIESVFILTLAFAQTKTRLLSHEKYIRNIVILAGVMFILILILYLAYQ